MLLHLGRVGVDGSPLAFQVIVDRRAEAPVRDVVRRPRERRLETARDLVVALRTRVELRDALLDAVLDALVIAGFEVEAVVVASRGLSPVASVERVGTLKEHGGA